MFGQWAPSSLGPTPFLVSHHHLSERVFNHIQAFTMETTADKNNASNQAVQLGAYEARLFFILRCRPAAYAFVQVNDHEDRRADTQVSSDLQKCCP